jgi:zinc protease
MTRKLYRTALLPVLLTGLFSSFPAAAQEVVELKQPAAGKLIVKLMFRNGSVSDPKGREGLTSLTADLVTEGGTDKLTASQIKEMIYPMAATYYSTVDKEVTIFTFAFHRDFAERFYPILKGLVLTPSFKEGDFSRVKKNHQNYVDQVIRASSDEEYSKLLLEGQVFRGTSYEYPVAGKSAGVSAVTLEDVKAHYRKVFTRNNLTVGIAGSYSKEFLDRLKADLKTLPDEHPSYSIQAPASPQGIHVEIVAKENTLGSAVTAGFPMPVTRSSNDFAALMVANSFLGEHRKSYSLLYQKIRTDRSMNYGDYSYIEWYQAGGSNMLPPPGYPRSQNYFSIWIRPVQTAFSLKKQYKELSGISTGHAHFAIRLAVRELDKLVSQGMKKEDFELTREFLRSYIKLYVQTPERRLGYLMDSRFYGRKDYIAEMDALLAKLSLDDVNKAIRKYWQTNNMHIAIVTDISEAQPLSESFKNSSPSPMSYPDALKETLPKDLLAEDEVIAVFPLPVKSVSVIRSADTFR